MLVISFPLIRGHIIFVSMVILTVTKNIRTEILHLLLEDFCSNVLRWFDSGEKANTGNNVENSKSALSQPN